MGHWLRRVLGLPYETGYYYGHRGAGRPPEGQKVMRGKGYFAHVDGNTVLIPGDPPSSGTEFGGGEGVGPEMPAERRGFDAGIVHALERDVSREALCPEGDQGAISVSLAEDLWFLLTEELSLWAVLLLEIALEMTLIVVFALLLTLASVAESSGEGTVGAIFRSKLLLSLTSVRLSTDSIFGWQTTRASSGLEVAILAVQGWAHWLLLSVAGAVIVARALRPLKQVVFSPDAILTDDEISVRMQILRHHAVELLNLEINFQAIATGGRVHQLPLANGVAGYAGWAGAAPLTIRHVIDENSPLHDDFPGGKLSLQYCRVSVSAVDSNGNPVNAVANYYAQDGFFYGMEDWQGAWRARGVLPPRILSGVRWKDQIRRIRDQTTGKAVVGHGLPVFYLNLDNFSQVEPIHLPV